MERKDELTLLGSKTEYRQDYAPEVLESFEIGRASCRERVLRLV